MTPFRCHGRLGQDPSPLSHGGPAPTGRRAPALRPPRLTCRPSCHGGRDPGSRTSGLPRALLVSPLVTAPIATAGAVGTGQRWFRYPGLGRGGEVEEPPHHRLDPSLRGTVVLVHHSADDGAPSANVTDMPSDSSSSRPSSRSSSVSTAVASPTGGGRNTCGIRESERHPTELLTVSPCAHNAQVLRITPMC